MATSSLGIPRGEVQSLVKLVTSNALLNRQLSTICQVNGLRSTGVKAELQKRIVTLINETAERGDVSQFRDIKRSIDIFKTGSSTSSSGSQPNYYGTSSSATHTSQTSHTMTNYNYSNGHGYGGVGGQRSQTLSHQAFYFKQSPFYEIRSRIGDIKTCEVMTQHRNSVTVTIKASDHPSLSLCLTDPSMRVMVFCAAANTGLQDIAFPHQAELKVNGGEIKANLRGLKNKPGSTRPVDITDQLRLKLPHYANSVEFTYALTNKKFYLVLNICKTVAVDTLVANISRGKRIPKASVILEIAKKAKDSDIVMSSQVVSLKCPLSYMRLSLPCRSTNCSHIQCFDATSYLQLQEQGPQWLCPICNKAAPFDQLAVDEYVKDILAKTSRSVEQVDIEPSGEWRAHGVEEEVKPEPSITPFAVDDDDLVISEVSFIGGDRSTTTPNRSAPFIGTPTTAASRESSTLPRSGSKSNKRPISQVIDLTLSDDDEPAQPPPKRQHYSTNGFGSSLSPY